MRRWSIVLALFLGMGLRVAHAATASSDDQCLACHADPSLVTQFVGGEMLPLYVDAGVFHASIHGDKVSCTECHVFPAESHPSGELPFRTRREYTLAMYDTCKQCHFSNYTKMIEGVHYDLLAQGVMEAPICVDCHGYHAVERPYKPRYAISKRCAQCHESIYNAYALSVHGRALIEEDNQDVPLCTDCHKAHNIEDPRSGHFRANIPEMCAHCHANDVLMSRYGLSTQVFQSYVSDFHGKAIALSKGAQERGENRLTAVCTDCHGVHDITKTDAPNSTVMKANLVQQCRNCHPTATENFPDAWISHYEVSYTKAPLVHLVKLFYKFFIPFMLLGLVLHILLHIWRLIVNR